MGNSGQIGLSLPALPSDWLSDTVFKLFRLFFCGFSRDDGQIATEVPLAPNLLILCGCQRRCWLYLAKTSAQDRLFTGFCGASGQSNLWQLYLPSRPDAPSSKWQTQSPASSSAQPPGRTALQMANTIPGIFICPAARVHRSPNGKYNPRHLHLPSRPDTPSSKWPSQKNTRSRPFRICSGHISFRYSSIKSNILTCSILKSDSTSRFTSSPFIWVASTLCTPLRMLDSRSFTT